jgi:hypothetical protein
MPNFQNIRPGDTVRFRVPNGIGRNGQEWKESQGKAVLCFSTHVVVNKGGRYGTPGVVNERNFVSCKAARNRVAY